MKIHEYQGKKILSKFNVPVQDGFIINDIKDAENIIQKVQKTFNTEDVIVKAQIHAGGRGKGGGVKYASNFTKALSYTKDILGMNLVTHQTGPEGKLVKKVFITEAYDIKREYYAAITLDRSKKMDVFMVSTEGGVNIEEVAEKTPEKIIKTWIHPMEYLSTKEAEKLAIGLNLSNNLKKDAIKIFKNMYKCYKDMDTTLLEINPLVVTEQEKVVALDAKFNFDSNALFRQQDVLKMQDLDEEDPAELEASEFDLNYVKLEGNVGCMVNGAGLAMATMDIIKISGGKPANFLDVGGKANADTIKNGFKIILKDKNVKAVLINIFGGIVRCDRVANGVVQAVNDLGLDVPVVVRLEGTNAEIAKEILSNSNVEIIPANNLQDAANKVVNVAIKEKN
ncbi:MAG: ADP-forming succinate--CoA ligase subunit beta [Candidatus Marinimicrobia bacterium]|nr:ADP-forming succinate--CoA ligase subunit beta [Candidatus Neomarinimicrobiota bacterium]|tara:strand:- start:18635 stop:19819 length:1185 start_codon:yes stop_codon:yes gene_type:complete